MQPVYASAVPSALRVRPNDKPCGIELHLQELVDICRTTDSVQMATYLDKLHDVICPTCDYKLERLSVSTRLSAAIGGRSGGNGRVPPEMSGSGTLGPNDAITSIRR